MYYFIGFPLISIFSLINCLGRDADEAKAEEFNEMVCKASLTDQQKQVQENINAQIKSFSMCINELLLVRVALVLLLTGMANLRTVLVRFCL